MRREEGRREGWNVGGSREGRIKGEEGRREGGREGGMEEGGWEARRDGGTERGKDGRREGTRAKPGNQLTSMLYLYPLVRPTLDYASSGCDLYTTQTVSLIISKTNRIVKRHIITCKQLCHVHMPCTYIIWHEYHSYIIFLSTC